MNIGINVSFLRKRGAGIGEVTHHFLTELVRQVAAGEVSAGVTFVLYAEEDFALPALDAAHPDVRARFTRRVFLPPYRRDDLVRKVLWERFLLPRRVRADKCDVLLSLYQCPTVISGVRHLMLVHDLVPRLFPQYTDNLRKRIYQRLSERAIVRADHIMTVSAHTAQDVVRELGVAPQRVTTHYIDCDPLFKQPSAHSAADVATVLAHYNLAPGYIYFGGGLDVRKNAQRLLQAYKMLRDEVHGDVIARSCDAHAAQRRSNLDQRSARLLRHSAIAPCLAMTSHDNVPPLVISGKLMPQLAPLVTDVEALVREYGLEEYVRVLGFVPHEHLPALYSAAAVFVYPSLYEGFGLPVLEAMSVGTPVVTSNVSSLPEVGGDAVAYCNPESVEDIARAVRTVLTDDALRTTLSTRGPKRAAQFSWSRFVREVMGVLVK